MNAKTLQRVLEQLALKLDTPLHEMDLTFYRHSIDVLVGDAPSKRKGAVVQIQTDGSVEIWVYDGVEPRAVKIAAAK